MKKIKKLKNKNIRYLVLLIVLLGIAVPISGNAEEKIQLYAKAAVLMDADSHRVLYSVNPDEILPMASTTKIMTLLVTLENADLDSIVTVSDYAASMPDVQLNCKSGEQYYLRDLIYSMMLESHNDSAVAIAEHVGGSVENFAQMMNEKAKELGCINTWFITPNGLDATQVITTENGEEERIHGTTARELADILSYCITESEKRELFLEITQTPAYTFSDLSGKRSFSCINHNALLTLLPGALTGKTGYTGKAGYCYTGAVRDGDRTLVVALLACGWPNHKTYKWQDTAKLVSYGFENYEKYDLNMLEIPSLCLTPIAISDRYKEMTEKSVQIREKEKKSRAEEILMRKDEEIDVKYERIVQMSAPAKRGDVVGKVCFYCGKDCVKEVILELGEDAEKETWKEVYQKMADYWIL